MAATSTMDQTEFENIERQLSTLLGVWAAGSVVKGGAIALLAKRTRHEQWMRFGRQTAMWGAVDGLIAGGGALARSRRGALKRKEVRAQADRLRTLLLVNAAADVLYVAGGLVIAARGSGDRTTFRLGRGDGLAIVIQGAFLLALDTAYARRLVEESS
jgi:hypothetical protein